jgi:hypothetical protein
MLVVQKVFYFVYSLFDGVVGNSNCIPCGDTEKRIIKEAVVAEFKTSAFGWLGLGKPRKMSTEIRIGHLLDTS